MYNGELYIPDCLFPTDNPLEIPCLLSDVQPVYGKKYSLSQEVGDIDKTFKELGKDVYVDINSSINTPQDFLNKQDVAKYMSSRNYDGIKALRYTDGNSERIMIVDGNHRFVAAKLNHERKVKMRIIE